MFRALLPSGVALRKRVDEIFLQNLGSEGANATELVQGHLLLALDAVVQQLHLAPRLQDAHFAQEEVELLLQDEEGDALLLADRQPGLHLRDLRPGLEECDQERKHAQSYLDFEGHGSGDLRHRRRDRARTLGSRASCAACVAAQSVDRIEVSQGCVKTAFQVTYLVASCKAVDHFAIVHSRYETDAQ